MLARLVTLSFISACVVEARVLRFRGQNAPLKSQQEIVFMRYMEDRNLVICGCGKCGTSSLYQYLWEQEFKQAWPYRYTSPCVQEVDSERWNGKFRMVNNFEEQTAIMKSAYSLALIRDPKERLLSSWKSKLACPSKDWHNGSRESEYGTDLDSAFFVQGLRKIQGLDADNNITCLSLEDFARTLHEIHQAGNAKYLDRHFLPQDLGCFYRFPPSHWSQVSTIESPNVFEAVAAKFDSSSEPPPHTHSSWAQIYVSETVASLFDAVTADEYKMMDPHVTPGQSKVRKGQTVLLRRPDV